MSIESDIRKMLGESKTSKPAEVIEPVELTDDEIVEGLLSLDELSKKTLGSYIKKGSQGVAIDVDKSVRGGLGSASSDHSFAAKHFVKAIKRLKGISKATDRLTKEQKETIETVLEELEDDEIVDENLTLEDFTLEELEDFVLSEDFDQLDEISGKTLGSYVQKARADIKSKYAHGKELDNDPKVKALDAKLKDFFNRKEYNKSGESKHRNQIDKTHVKIFNTKKKIDPNYPKSANPGRRHAGIRKAIDKLNYGKLTNEDITVDVSEDVDALLNGEDQLTEEFKTKAATIFEAAVVTRVKGEVARLEESYETRLQEEVESIKEGLAEKVDGYLNYIVEQWIIDNEIALTHGIKNEIMENFITGIKGVFEENYIDVPEEKFDVLGELEAKYAELESKLNEAVEKNVELHGKVNGMKRTSTILEAADGLSDVQVEKFVSLAEELSYENEESFIEKLKVIRENYFTKKTPARITETFITDEPINEEINEVKLDPAMSAYVKTLNKK